MQSEQFILHQKMEHVHWWFRARRKILKSLVDALLQNRSESLIVDIGCGSGGNAAALAGSYRVIGVDASEEMISLAREHKSAHSLDVDYFVGGTPELAPEPVSRAHLYMCTDVLEHIQEEKEFLARWVQQAPVGSYFLLTVPADQALWSDHDVSHGHFRRYSRANWEAVWHGLPVNTLFTSYFNFALYPAVRLVRTLSRLRKRSYGEANTDLAIPWAPINRFLEFLFGLERYHLLNLLSRKSELAFPFGVSLISVLQKTEPSASSTLRLTEH